MSSGSDVLRRAFLGLLTDLDGERLAFEHLRAHRVEVARELAAPEVLVLAIGKMAPAMAAGALRALGARVADGLVIAPHGTPSALPPAVRVLRSDHPLPGAASVAAAEEAMAFVRARRRAAVLVLLSGGASALCALPRGVSLADKRAITAALLNGGAPIASINAVRRHLSWIKGGGLVRAAAPRNVVTLAVSDVLTGGPADIGSGPTVVDPTTTDDARRALRQYAPAFADVPLRSTLRPGAPSGRRSSFRLVLGPAIAAARLVEQLRREGIAPRRLPASDATVEALVVEYTRLAAALAPGEAWVRAAEPTLVVTAPAPGRGGRSSHLAASLVGRLPPGVAFLAGATDGADGASDGAGAVVSGDAASALEASAALRAFDSATWLDGRGELLRTGPTGVNVADVHALLRPKAG